MASTAGDVVLAYLARRVAEVRRLAPGAAAGRVEDIHQMRVAVRRLRSVLGSCHSLFDGSAVDPLRDELRWLSGVLGAARDPGVVRDRLLEAAAREPAALRWAGDPAADLIRTRLDADAAAGLAAAADALTGARYERLLAAIDTCLADPPLAPAAADPPLAPAAAAPARRVHRAVRRDSKRLVRTAAALAEANGGAEHDVVLHTVRKAAKRLRYSAELMLEAVPDGPTKRLKYARRAAKGARTVQQVLGLHQDSVMARSVLVELARESDPGAGAGSAVGFGLGRLHAAEDVRAAAAEKKFHKSWRRLRRKL
ncbi:CHAD domain-containing protein [Arthrobacter sp. YD4]|uniref:CHAD domain-containing protein n=1 Tax=Arthrobacter sp. YD4 TaxID=3058043 RepID=UPI0025B3F4FB|nr:CHAD domain-containing protein [Arthrobacter sp. YD4]MDN3935252.1 CHAD domain-containing protein [Arthrobacter sp. YD4]